MPEPGFQHKGNIATINPFDEDTLKLSPYTVAEIATLQSRLDRQLGPEYISSRPGAGGIKVHYLAAEKVINLANEVFGFNGWSSSIRNIQIDFVDESKEGRVSLGLSVIMRVTLKDGTYHEDVGYGHIENCKGKAAAFDKAKKEGTTDALKRALRNFGNVLGNCVYDKNYIKEVTKLRAPQTRFNPSNLHRHPDFAGSTSNTAPKNSTTLVRSEDVKPDPVKLDDSINGDEYGGDEFDDEFSGIFVEGEDSTFQGLLSDEIATESSNLMPTNGNQAFTGQSNIRAVSNTGGPSPVNSPSLKRRAAPAQFTHSGPQTPTPKQNQHQQFQRQPLQQNYQQKPPPRPPVQNAQGQGTSPTTNHSYSMGPPPQRPSAMQTQNQESPSRSATPSNSVPTLPAPQLNNAQQNNSNQPSAPVGFFSARAAESLQGDNVPPEAPAFNPHRQSSIPRSAGIDHTKSSPIPRKFLGNTVGGNNGMPNIPKPDFSGGFNPARQIGMPPQAQPQHNRTPYRPPSAVGAPQGYQGAAGIKRPAADAGLGAGQKIQRQALGDASVAQLNAQDRQAQGHFNGNDPKRMRG